MCLLCRLVWITWTLLLFGVVVALLPRLSADLGTLVLVGDFGGSGNDIYTYDILGRDLQPLVVAERDFAGRYIQSAACPPGSSRVYFTGSGLASADLTTGELRRHTSITRTTYLSTNPRGDALVISGWDADSLALDMFRYDILTDTMEPLYRNDRNKFWPTWSPDGGRFAFSVTDYAGTRDQVLVRTPGELTVAHRYNTRPFSIARMAWSPVRDEIAVVELKGSVWLLTLVRERDDVRELASGISQQSLQWSADGDMLIYNQRQDTLRARDMRLGLTAPLVTTGVIYSADCWLHSSR